MPKIIQIEVTSADEMFALTDCGHLLFDTVDGWKLMPDPDWEGLGLGGEPEPAQPAPELKETCMEISIEAAEVLAERWTIGEASQFCDESEFSYVDIADIAQVIEPFLVRAASVKHASMPAGHGSSEYDAMPPLVVEHGGKTLGSVQPVQPAPESPWVKVCDRLPDGQNRLVLVKFSDMLGETVNTMWSMKIADNINSGQITHWMEIPEVPCD